MCSKYGDSAFALEQGLIEMQDVVKLGRVIQVSLLHWMAVHRRPGKGRDPGTVDQWRQRDVQRI
jgi:hypothetical protein